VGHLAAVIEHGAWFKPRSNRVTAKGKRKTRPQSKPQSRRASQAKLQPH
jgi:hypothetical protein